MGACAWRRPRVLLCGAIAAVASAGCTASDPEQPGCPAGSNVVHVESTAQLEAAADTASPGTCLALMSGEYEALELPPGVSLVGDGRDAVTLVGVTVHGGQNAVLSTFTVRGLGITVADEATLVRISNVHVDESGADGIDVQAGAGVTVETVAIDDAVGAGVKAMDAGSVVLTDVTIERTGGPAVSARCGSDCDCSLGQSFVSMTRLAARELGGVGIALEGVAGDVDTVEITDVRPSAGSEVAAGLTARGCSWLAGQSLRVFDPDPENGAMLGLSIDGSAVALGQAGSPGFEIEGARGAVWIQGQPPGDLLVSMANGKIRGSRGVSIGLGPGAARVVLEDIEIDGTTAVTMEVTDGGNPSTSEVGDALVWHAGTHASFDRLTIARSGRLGLLIDGAVGVGSMLGTLTLGESAGKLVQQSFGGRGAPETGPGTPPIETSADELYPVPIPPASDDAP